MLAPLAHPVFRRLFLARVIALTGTGLTTVALALLAYELAPDRAGLVLGAAFAIKMVAYVAVAPIAGAYTHLFPRRHWLVGLDLLRAAAIACLPFVDGLGAIYAIIFVVNACSAAFTPIFQATIPDLLTDEEEYTEALSLSRLAQEFEALASPLLAAVLLTLGSHDALFILNGAAFLLSAALIGTLTLPRPDAPERSAAFVSNISFGVRCYLATPRLRGLLLLCVPVALGGSMVIVNSVVYVRERLGLGESETAIAFAAAGAGSMAAALSVPRLASHASVRLIMLTGSALLTLALAAGLLRPGYTGLLLAWWVVGFGWALVETPAGRLLQASSTPKDRPAYYSAHFALSHALWLVAYPLMGWLATRYGISTAFAVAWAASAIAACAAWRLWPARDPLGEAAIWHTHDEGLEGETHTHLHYHDEHHQHDHQHDGSSGNEPHAHPHSHPKLAHRHRLVIDLHHDRFPR